MALQKRIIAGMTALAVAVGAQFLPAGAGFGMRVAEADGLGGLIGGIVGMFVPRTLEEFVAEHEKMMEDLGISAIYTAEAELATGQALELEPEKLQAVSVTLQALANSPRDMNAIRTSTQVQLPEAELRSRASALMSVEDKVRMASLKDHMETAATYRSAARSHSRKAAGHAAKIIAGAALGIAQDSSAENIAATLAVVIASAEEAQKIQKIQSEHSKNLRLITKDLEKRLKVKEPKEKEAKQLAAQMRQKK